MQHKCIIRPRTHTFQKNKIQSVEKHLKKALYAWKYFVMRYKENQESLTLKKPVWTEQLHQSSDTELKIKHEEAITIHKISTWFAFSFFPFLMLYILYQCFFRRYPLEHGFCRSGAQYNLIRWNLNVLIAELLSRFLEVCNETYHSFAI